MRPIKRLLFIFPFIFFLVFPLCEVKEDRLDEWMREEKKIRVLSTTAMIGNIVEEVGGEYVDVLTLIEGDLDPHTYEIVKGDAEKFLRADLVFANGLGLEHGSTLHKQLHRKGALFLGDIVYQERPHDFLTTDVGLDPHFWMDVSLFAEIIDPIVNSLKEKAPEHSLYFEKRGGELKKDLEELDRNIANLMDQIPSSNRYLITSHDAFEYFSRRYLATITEQLSGKWKERFLAPEGISPDGQLGPLDIQKIIDHVLAYRVLTVFAESNLSLDSLDKIIDACKINGVPLELAKKPLHGDSMGEETYIKMMWHNAATIREELIEE